MENLVAELLACLCVIDRPFYSCFPSDLVFECQWGRSWPCFDKDLTAFLCNLGAFTWQMLKGLYQRKVTSSLTSMVRPGHPAGNCKKFLMVYWGKWFGNLTKFLVLYMFLFAILGADPAQNLNTKDSYLCLLNY